MKTAQSTHILTVMILIAFAQQVILETIINVFQTVQLIQPLMLMETVFALEVESFMEINV